jgi:hypothetical protein
MNYAFTNCVYFVVLPGINAMPGVLTANISYIKRKRTTGNEQVYLLKAWVKDIEPPISSKYFLSTKIKM